jgi:glutaminyl-tRNA synthetase
VVLFNKFDFFKQKSDQSTDDDEVCELIVTGEKLSVDNKPKAFIHWVAKPIKCQVRLYDRL